METPRSAGTSLCLECLALVPWPRGRALCTFQPPTMSCYLMSSTALTPTSDHQISSFLTLLIPHSVPSKRGTRSRVQLDLSPGCTWHERTPHTSWCDKKIREFRESLRLTNTAVPNFMLHLNGVCPRCLVSPQLPNNASKFPHFSCYWAKVVGMSKDHHHQL